MAEWTPPTGATPQQDPNGRRLDDGMGHLRDLLAEVKTTLRDVPNHLLQQSGIYVAPEGMTIDSALRITGDTVIEGSLDVPNAKIKNDWLENPIEFSSARASEYEFAISTTQTERGHSSLVVPTGYSRALITVFASLIATNNSASTQYVYLRAQARVVGTGAYQYSLRQQITLAPGFWGTLIVPMIFAADTPAGDTIQGMGLTYASGDLASDPSVVCDSELSVTFTR